MVRRFQKSCDIAALWEQQTIESIKDAAFKSNVVKRQQLYKKEWSDFEECRSKHSLLQHQYFDI
jgi:hypothetical protein